MANIIAEACVDSLDKAIQAEKNGANQLELCERLDLGGLTPNLDLVMSVCNAVDIPVKVMLRNRGGDYVYSIEDIIEMKSSLLELTQIDIQGIVFGAMQVDNTIDIDLTKQICDLAGMLPITFHKAIDRSDDLAQAILSLKQTEVKYILSSGGEDTASLGAKKLKMMNTLAKPDITIIAAGKININNLEDIHRKVGAGIYHGKSIVGNLSIK